MKKIVSSSLLSVAVLGLGATLSYAAPAAGVTLDTPEAGQVQSEANVSVLGGDDNIPTPPEDINEPDGTTDQPGPLSLDQVIVFNFEDTRLRGTTTTSELISKTPQNVQVTDTRGTGAGWNLLVKQTALVDGEKELKGAYINLDNPFVKAGASIVDPTLAPTSPTYSATAANKGEFASIMTAEAGKGMGTWLQYYNKDNAQDITLTIPAGNLTGDYAGHVIWQLDDTPATVAP